MPTTREQERCNSGDAASNEDVIKNLLQMIFRKEIVKQPEMYSREDDARIHINRIEDYLRLTTVSKDEERLVYCLIV